MSTEIESYVRQGFGATLEAKAPVGLLIVDFVNGFADPSDYQHWFLNPDKAQMYLASVTSGPSSA